MGTNIRTLIVASLYMFQKKPSRGVLSKRYSENMPQIYRTQHGCSLVNLLHIFRTPFLKNISGGLLLMFTNMSLEICVHVAYAYARKLERLACFVSEDTFKS